MKLRVDYHTAPCTFCILMELIRHRTVSENRAHPIIRISGPRVTNPGRESGSGIWILHPLTEQYFSWISNKFFQTLEYLRVFQVNEY